MSRLSRVTLLVPVTATLVTCGDSFKAITELPRQLSVAEGKLIEADNRFAFNLFRAVDDLEGDNNVFISPLSVAMALGMAYNGADGNTQQAMQQTLELAGMSVQEVNEAYRDLIGLLRNLDPRVEFLLANSIWYRDTWTFEQEFIDINRQYFDAEVAALDFTSPAAAPTINGWVSNATHGRIAGIVPDPVPNDIVMYLINAIYFKGDWTYQFDKSRTRGAPFDLPDGSQTTVDMMSHEADVEVGVNWSAGVHVGDLPYGGEAYSMTILLPPTATQIDSLVDQLTQENWSEWVGQIHTEEIHVSIPKFTLEYEIKLNDALTALGMGIAFSDTADFTRMYAPGEIFISEVKHKTFVDVNEEGTEAAAATSVGMAPTSMPLSFIVDRPFVFVIRERLSGTILFMGKVVDPTQG
ncbi:MAG: serpin family protein [Gemmatimonadota bacterium]|nr:MAG: serpin family protein [Gemmatimonadota bacterium]